jgi:ABC-type multidrug transport system permease subunit
MISGMIYFMWSLHCGFIIPEPSYPGWWVWLYYINPVSWILYGFVASQLGRVTSSFEQVGAFPHFYSDAQIMDASADRRCPVHHITRLRHAVLVQDDGTVITVKAYLRQHFNFRYDMLGVAVAVLVAYIAIYGCVSVRSPPTWLSSATPATSRRLLCRIGIQLIPTSCAGWAQLWR